MRLTYIMGLTAVLVMGSLTGAGTVASPGADFSLIPVNQTVSVGQVFTIDIGVDAVSQELDTVEAHVNFDPTCLQVVDEDDNLLAGVTDGAIVPGSITTTALTTGLLNRVDNGSGHAGIAYGIPLVEGTLVNQAFILGTIRFKAVAESAGTTITFSTGTGRVTLAVRSGTNVTGDLAGSIVAITATDSPGEESPAPNSETLSDTVSLTTSSSGEKAAGDVESDKVSGTADASEDGETPLSPQDKPLTWPIVGGIIGGILVIGLVVYFFTARGRF